MLSWFVSGFHGLCQYGHCIILCLGTHTNVNLDPVDLDFSKQVVICYFDSFVIVSPDQKARLELIPEITIFVSKF